MNNNKFKYTALSAAIVLALSACGGSDNNSEPENKDRAPQAGVTQLQDVKLWQTVSGEIKASDADGDNLAIAIFDGDTQITPQDNVYTLSHGILTLKGIKAFDYLPMTGEAATIKYTVTSKGKSASSSIEIPASISDPLANQQWHLNNTAQKSFSQSDAYVSAIAKFRAGREPTPEKIAAEEKAERDRFEGSTVAGIDLNVTEAYSLGVTGKGVVAVVVDRGVDIRHEDLANNVLSGRSINLHPQASDPTDPTTAGYWKEVKDDDGNFVKLEYVANDEIYHGTAVAGLILAEGWNGLGGRGVAPNSSLVSINYLDYQLGGLTHDAIIHGLDGSGIQKHEDVLFNRSYGYNPPVFLPEDPIEDALFSYAPTQLRDGKGALSVNAAGNDFVNGRINGDYCLRTDVAETGLSCIDVNVSQQNRTPHGITVAALAANGKKASYSTTGSAIFISAPAGEDGRGAPAMITTDEMGCLEGASSFVAMEWLYTYGSNDFVSGYAHFDYPGHPMNANCNYTNSMSGTSSAAPNTSGVIALMMEANPELTARDIRHILATTAVKNDPENQPVELETGNGKFTAHLGWTTNAAGYNFNNYYGFGLANAGAAVKMALNYSDDLGTQVTSEWQDAGAQILEAVAVEDGVSELVMPAEPSLDLTIPDNNAEGVTHSIVVDEDATIESMQFRFTISNPQMVLFKNPDVPGDTVSSAGTDLALEVTSPSGTKAIILSSKQAQLRPAIMEGSYQDGYIHLPSVHFLSNAFYGETAKGTWTLRAIDTDKPATTVYKNRNKLSSVVLANSEPSKLEGWGLRVIGRK
ncbi:S8 family serine peptidase [Pseudoalteromonas piscicida]|uniref:Serine protease n=1 Tax=Pseudoalteromonas piscicida TaxID=43662 RepID=A0A2A5JQU0_PSEO7|nr:S8 family serine peptidase [Pseudoalteromonas piscicida]PCK31795.1 serine protease [Pseudoalteromonas piscicida]